MPAVAMDTMEHSKASRVMCYIKCNHVLHSCHCHLSRLGLQFLCCLGTCWGMVSVCVLFKAGEQTWAPNLDSRGAAIVLPIVYLHMQHQARRPHAVKTFLRTWPYVVLSISCQATCALTILLSIFQQLRLCLRSLV